MSQYTNLVEYAMKLINDRTQAEIIIEDSVKGTVKMFLDGNIEATEGRSSLYKSIRDKCYEYLRLKQSLAESL